MATRNSRARKLRKLRASFPAFFSTLLFLVGFGMLSAAAWTVHIAAGLGAIGVSCLILGWLYSPDDEEE